MNTLTRRCAAWAACLAILMAALAPSISHALSVSRGADIAWMEVCSTSGLKFVEAAASQDEAAPSSSSDSMTQSAHCPFCSTHAASFCLPPAAVGAFPIAGNARMMPFLFYQAPGPQFIWSGALSRGPPSVS
ncbi:MAG: DUF2946 domain-containing protein [Noviherbaspirillum sp.]